MPPFISLLSIPLIMPSSAFSLVHHSDPFIRTFYTRQLALGGGDDAGRAAKLHAAGAADVLVAAVTSFATNEVSTPSFTPLLRWVMGVCPGGLNHAAPSLPPAMSLRTLWSTPPRRCVPCPWVAAPANDDWCVSFACPH
jgi:hypothetical protein